MVLRRLALAITPLILAAGCAGASNPTAPTASPSNSPATPSPSPTPVPTPSARPSTPPPSATPEPADTLGATFEWADGVEVSVTKMERARMTAEDVEDSDPDGKVGETLVRFFVKVTNGSPETLRDLYCDMTVSYGPDGISADERFPVGEEVEDIDTIQPGRAKTVTETFTIPAKFQGEVTLDFELDGDHDPATFSGAVK